MGLTDTYSSDIIFIADRWDTEPQKIAMPLGITSGMLSVNLLQVDAFLFITAQTLA